MIAAKLGSSPGVRVSSEYRIIPVLSDYKSGPLGSRAKTGEVRKNHVVGFRRFVLVIAQ
jgi:hypothetical protein